jgi:hypothetical protein
MRTGIDVAVRAGLVALAANVDLQRLKRAARERDFVFGKFLLKAIHEGRSAGAICVSVGLVKVMCKQ